jgi:hypothetical protein
VGANELSPDPGGQAVELYPKSRAFKEIIEGLRLRLTLGTRDDAVASIALDRGRRRESARREHCPEHRGDHRSTSHLSPPGARRARLPGGGCISSARESRF